MLEALERKLMPYLRLKETSSPKSPEWEAADADGARWNKIAAVLLVDEVRVVYNMKVLGPVRKGFTIRKVLKELCEKRWEEEVGEGEKGEFE